MNRYMAGIFNRQGKVTWTICVGVSVLFFRRFYEKQNISFYQYLASGISF